jgi:O-antigen/teichoic acid export membrane protein
VGFFRILPDFGMSYASALAISRDRGVAARLMGNLLGFQALLSILTLGLCLALGHLLFRGNVWWAVAILSVDLLLKSLKSTLRWLLKSFESFGTEAASLLIERLLLLGFGSLVLLAGGGVLGFVLVFACVRLVETSGLYAWIHLRSVPLRPHRDLAFWLDLLRKGLPFAYAGLMITLFFQVDAVMLEKMRGAQEVGWYSAPVRILEGAGLVPRILGFALIPTMAALFPTDPGAVTALYRRGSKYLLLAGLPIATFGVLDSDLLVRWLFGPAYGPSVPISMLLIPASLLMFLSNFGETTLACVNRWGTIVVSSTVALLVNVALNLVWIPTHGMRGAAWATLVTESAYFALTAGALWAYGHRFSWLRLLPRPMLATALFAATLYLLRGLDLILASALASVVFVASSFPLGVWDAREKELMRGLLRRSG